MANFFYAVILVVYFSFIKYIFEMWKFQCYIGNIRVSSQWIYTVNLVVQNFLF